MVCDSGNTSVPVECASLSRCCAPGHQVLYIQHITAHISTCFQPFTTSWPYRVPSASATPPLSLPGFSLGQVQVNVGSMVPSVRVTRRFGHVTSLVLIGLEAVRSRLDVIDLPIGFFPEGITRGDNDWTAYVGSLAGDNPYDERMPTFRVGGWFIVGESFSYTSELPVVFEPRPRRTYLFQS